MLVRDILEHGNFCIDLNSSLESALSIMQINKKGAVVIINKHNRAEGIITERDILRLLSKNVDFSLPIRDYMTRALIKIHESRNLLHALTLMTEHTIRRLIVTDDSGNFKSLLTQQDILKHIEDDIYRANIKVKYIIDGYELIYAKEDDTLATVLKLMSSNNIGAIPILKNKIPVGILSERDILNFASSKVDLESSLKDYMSLNPITVTESTLIVDVAKKMNDFGVRRVIVVNGAGEALGIISQRDIIKSLEYDYKNFLERKLRHTKDILNLLPEMVIEIVDTKREQIIVWANIKAIEFFGRDIIDSPINHFLKGDNWFNIYMNIYRNGKLDRYKFNLNSKTLELSGFLLEQFEESSNEVRIKLIIRDITESEKAKLKIEDELNTYLRIINSTADMIILYNSDYGNIKIANDSTIKSLGYSKDELLSLSIFDIVVENSEFLKQKIVEIVRDDRVVKGRRTYRKNSGELIPVEITATKVVINGSIYILIVARDIGEKLLLENQVRERNEQLMLFHNFINSLNRSVSIDEAFDVLTFYLRKLRIDSIHIYKINPSLTKIVDTRVNQNEPLWREDCLCDTVFECKSIISGSKFLKNSEFEFGCPLIHVKNVKSYLCLNIYSSGKIIGIISLLSKIDNFFDHDRVRFLNDINNAFSLFLSNLKLIELNRDLSIRDPLTNLYNRRFLNEFFEKELEKVKRSDDYLSIIMIDLDNFKQVNDIYGHDGGDMALKATASIIDRVARKSDIAARFGGEEFILILPNTDKNGATNMAERIRTVIESSEIDVSSNQKIRVSASIGVATFNDDTRIDDYTVINIADKRLYQAKRTGKNRVINSD